MGWKNIKQQFCPDFDIYQDSEKKEIRICLFGREAITINTINFEVTPRALALSSYQLKLLCNKLEQAKQRGELKRLYDNPDIFIQDLPVYTIKDNKIVQEVCEEYGYEKPTHAGERMGKTYFETRKVAKAYLRKQTKEELSNTFKYSFRDAFGKAFSGIGKLIRAAWVWVKVRIL